MISEIKIKGYKSIKDEKVYLNNINILIGGNGVGKSNFISMFTLLRNIYEKNLGNYINKKGGANKFLHLSSKYTKRIVLGLEFNDINRYMVQLASTNQDNLFIEAEHTEFKNDNNVWREKEYARNVNESDMKFTTYSQAYYVSNLLNQFRVYHFHDTSDTSAIKRINDLNDNYFLQDDGSNIAAFLYFLQQKHNKHFKRIEKTIKSVAPFFNSFSLAPSQLNEDKIRLEWKEDGAPDVYLDVTSLSDGTLRFICLVTLLMQPNPSKTIIIDEPELGLHPFAISKLASLVRKVSHKSQVIISTQSSLFVDEFDAKDIIAVDRKDNATVFNRLNKDKLEHWLEDYSLGQIWNKNIIGGRP